MTPEIFIKTYLPGAISASKRTGFHKDIFLTAGAQETGWKIPPGNNFFGIKDTDGVNGNEHLVTTTEYHNSPNVKYPVNISTVKVALKKWKYKVKDWFRKYDNAEKSFLDYARFFEVNPRYRTALLFKNQPERFFEEIAKAGYATDPHYADNLKAVLKSVRKRL